MLEALPTVFVVLIFYFFLRTQFFRPLEKAMSERRARIEGARKSAEASRAAAQEKLRAYEEALKKARSKIYAEQDAARRVVLEERGTLIRQARERAQQTVRAGKEQIAAEVAAARQRLEVESQSLAAEIVRAILAAPGEGPRASGGAR